MSGTGIRNLRTKIIMKSLLLIQILLLLYLTAYNQNTERYSLSEDSLFYTKAAILTDTLYKDSLVIKNLRKKYSSEDTIPFTVINLSQQQIYFVVYLQYKVSIRQSFNELPLIDKNKRLLDNKGLILRNIFKIPPYSDTTMILNNTSEYRIKNIANGIYRILLKYGTSPDNDFSVETYSGEFSILKNRSYF